MVKSWAPSKTTHQLYLKTTAPAVFMVPRGWTPQILVTPLEHNKITWIFYTDLHQTSCSHSCSSEDEQETVLADSSPRCKITRAKISPIQEVQPGQSVETPEWVKQLPLFPVHFLFWEKKTIVLFCALTCFWLHHLRTLFFLDEMFRYIMVQHPPLRCNGFKRSSSARTEPPRHKSHIPTSPAAAVVASGFFFICQVFVFLRTTCYTFTPDFGKLSPGGWKHQAW